MDRAPVAMGLVRLLLMVVPACLLPTALSDLSVVEFRCQSSPRPRPSLAPFELGFHEHPIIAIFIAVRGERHCSAVAHSFEADLGWAVRQFQRLAIDRKSATEGASDGQVRQTLPADGG